MARFVTNFPLLLHPPLVNRSSGLEGRTRNTRNVRQFELQFQRFGGVLRVALCPLVLELGEFLAKGLLVELLALFLGLNDQMTSGIV